MAEETTREFINRRKKELMFQISALRGQLGPKEEELAELVRMEAALTSSGTPTLASLLATQPIAPGAGALTAPQSQSLAGLLGGGESPRDRASMPWAPDYSAGLQQFPSPVMTIKAMALNALRDHFHDGATPSELRDYIKSVYGRDIDRNSIGPQLGRLREQGAVEQTSGPDAKWIISRGGKWYDHPTSFDLKDEPEKR
jgi:hypothetical protein